MVGYNHDPDFIVAAPDQASQEQRIAYALKHHPVFREALKAEGIDPRLTPLSQTPNSSLRLPTPRNYKPSLEQGAVRRPLIFVVRLPFQIAH